MPKPIRRIVMSVALLTALCAQDAVGQDASTDREPGTRLMTYITRNTDSKCIDNPVTPLCAAETYEACVHWNDPTLCEAVGRKFDNRWYAGGDMALTIHHYRPLGQVVLAEDAIPDWARREHFGWAPWQAGDVALDILWQSCRPDEACVRPTRGRRDQPLGAGCPVTRCEWHRLPRTYIVRRVGDRWHLIDFHDANTSGRKWPEKPPMSPIATE